MDSNPLVRLRRSVFALPLAALAALVVVVINESGFANSSASLATLVEKGDARAQVQFVLRQLVDAETGQRGYLLTGRKSYLEPYDDSVSTLAESLRRLHTFYDKDPVSLAHLQAIETKAREKMSEIATTLEAYDRGKHEQWRELVMSDIGKEKMDEVRKAAVTLRDAESARILTQRLAVDNTLQASRIGVNAMVAVALIALLLFLRKTQALDRVQLEHAKALGAERDQLEAEVARRTAELTDLAQHLESAREDERSRLARELHDELGALLTAAKLDAARLKRTLAPMPPAVEDGMKRLNTSLDQGISLKRHIIENLRPSSLTNLGLVAALEIQTREFAQRTEMKVHTELQPAALSENAQITVYRLVQESLTNIAKYAKATEVTVTLVGDGERVRISVRDNGTGFDPTRTRRSAHGLTGMRFRVEGLGGAMNVSSAPGQGTTIAAWLPLATRVSSLAG